MAKVIAGFRDKETQIIYVIGDEYEGSRETELVEKGFLEGEKEVSKYAGLSVDELKELLTERGIEFKETSKPATFIKLLEKADATADAE
ncbi:hypothetical protein [Streptococcus suis]|uniref:hypothetical protein n=1 Tax=Streptococcus suis TaxID=1307 RepID=UPI0028743468|nr:hypothetical protein [Streptococcus suis]MDS1161638.1 hypothetical protein [Streptococcus suis]